MLGRERNLMFCKKKILPAFLFSNLKVYILISLCLSLYTWLSILPDTVLYSHFPALSILNMFLHFYSDIPSIAFKKLIIAWFFPLMSFALFAQMSAGFFFSFYLNLSNFTRLCLGLGHFRSVVSYTLCALSVNNFRSFSI